ncbi:cysteine-rich KTR domain-containing protein [Coprococcus sp. OM04-5BH]
MDILSTCGNRPRNKIRKYKIKNFPLYCPKCKREPLIEVRERFSS